MPSMNHAPAILRWWEGVTKQEGGLGAFEQSATISTMLFACNRWLSTNAGSSTASEIAQIERIKSELGGWMDDHGLQFTE
jgi:hypothetical protein